MPLMLDWTCTHCGKIYQIFHFEADRAKFCSTACQHAHKRNRVQAQCVKCGKTFERIVSQPTPKYCSAECYGKPRKLRSELVCPVCGKTQTLTAGRAAKRTYCSLECRAIGSRNRIARICKQCKKPFQTEANAKAGLDFCCLACYHASLPARITITCEVCDKQRTLPRNLGVVTRYCSRRCAHIGAGETSIEKAVRAALADLKIRYEFQYQVSRYAIDFYLPDRAIAIEADGEYWHTGREARDARKDAFLASKGITTIRIAEREIKATADISKLVRDKLKGIHTLGI